MKIKAFHMVIAMIVVCIAILLVIDNVNDSSKTESFAKFYEPCEPQISLEFTDYELPLDTNDIVNFATVGKVIDVNLLSSLIRQNGFAVMGTDFRSNIVDFVEVYKTFKDQQNPPLFVTTDTGLYLYHSIFDQTLRDIEERLFISDIKDLTNVLLNDAIEKFNNLDGDLKEVAQRNVAYLSVAQKLIDPNTSIPKFVENTVINEVERIEMHQGMLESIIFKYVEDYSQFVPRGHYTRNEKLKRYFKTMMWYGRMAFLIKGSENWGADGDALVNKLDAKIQTMQACMLAVSLKNIKVGERVGLDVWKRIYTVTSFFVGFADNLTPDDYLWAIDKVYGNRFELRYLADEKKFFALREKLLALAPSKIYSGTGNIVVSGPISEESYHDILNKTMGMHFMGQRFIPDSYIFRNLTYPQVNGYTGDPNKKPFTADDTYGNRSYIRGLDLMAVLGSDEAKKILTDYNDTNFKNYEKRFEELKTEFDSLSLNNWNQNLYWSWLYCLKGLLQELPGGYPNFMSTQAWQRSRLNAALASWTQLRHDTILISKPSLTPPPFIMRIPPGYIEPNPVFWGRLLSLVRMTRRGLEDFNIRTNDIMRKEVLLRIDKLEKLIQKIINIVNKQLADKQLSKEDKEFFEGLSDILLGLTMDNDTYYPIRATLVSDVHTFPLEGLIVEEGVGYVDIIVVACPLTDGKAFLAAGPVFSYYEFKHPMDNRLTDEAWLKMLESPQKPERPDWYIPLMVQKEETNK